MAGAVGSSNMAGIVEERKVNKSPRARAADQPGKISHHDGSKANCGEE